MLRVSGRTVSKRLAALSVATASTGGAAFYYQQCKLVNNAKSSDRTDANTEAMSLSIIQQKIQATSAHINGNDNNLHDKTVGNDSMWNNALSIDTLHETISQIKPLLEASIRAAKLVQTVTLVIMDYKLDEYRNVFEFMGMESGGDNETRKHLKSLEISVQHRSQELQEAQKNYASNDDDGGVGYDEGIKKDDNTSTSPVPKQTTEEKRQQVLHAARQLAQAEEVLNQAQASASDQNALPSSRNDDHKSSDAMNTDNNNDDCDEMDNTIHACAARRIRDLCRSNGGTYIKVGQHLANLDHLLPPAYIQVLHSLFGDAPTSDYNDVREVIREELGEYPEQIFDEFDQDPIASASLAQVHIAWKDGHKFAVKVQHRGLRETSKGDLMALEGVVRLVDQLFDEFKWGWIVDEIAPNLPKELDFHHEGKNAEAAEKFIKEAGLENDCIVPKVHWDLTTERILVMDFEHGHSATDVQAIEKAGIRKRDLAVLISSVFQSQIFQSGFVHCDPHPANVFWRPKSGGKPQLVLFDHGLYKKIDDEFRLTYAKLWKSLLMADINGIKESCESLGVCEMYPLLSAMLTSRPFDEIKQRSKSGSFTAKDGDLMDTKSDAAMIRGYAQQYLKEIIQMLDKVPRQMLLLFKMNDCLRHIDYALGSPANTLIIAGKYAIQTVHDDDYNKGKVGFVERMRYFLIMTRIKMFELISNTSTFLINM